MASAGMQISIQIDEDKNGFDLFSHKINIQCETFLWNSNYKLQNKSVDFIFFAFFLFLHLRTENKTEMFKLCICTISYSSI